MKFTIYLAAFTVVIIASASGQIYNVTSPTQDFFLLSQRQLRSDIAVSEAKIDSVNAQGVSNLKVISDQQKVVVQEINRVEEELLPLQALSLIRKHCIQKYKPQLLPSETAQKQYDLCITAAQSRINSMTTAARNSLNLAKTAVNTNLPKAIATCNTTNANNQTKLEECVLTNVDTYSKTVQTNLNLVDKNLEASICTLNDLSRDAIQCSFRTERPALVSIGTVLELIDNCIKVTESVCPCGNPNSTSILEEPSIRSIIMGA